MRCQTLPKRRGLVVAPPERHFAARCRRYTAPVSSRMHRRRGNVRRRRVVLGAVVVLVALGVALAALGGGAPTATRLSPPTTTGTVATTVTPTSQPPSPPFGVGTVSFTFAEPGAPGSTVRTLPTTVRYPAIATPGTPDQAGVAPLRSGGPYPLLVFSEGYDIGPEAYSLLLDAWAAAGYVVADPVYPFTSPTSPGGLLRTDIVHHPADLSYVITSLLDDSAAHGGTLSGLINPAEVGVIGQSDGGDVSLAAASNTCCRDNRIKAAAILSGAELTWFPGTYYSTPAVPLLVVQGTNDPTYNPPSCSIQLYNQAPQPKYFLSMIGQTHESAYLVAGPPLEVVAKVTIDFLDRYLQHSAPKLGAMTRDGNVPGLATLTTTSSLGPAPGSCPGAPAG